MTATTAASEKVDGAAIIAPNRVSQANRPESSLRTPPGGCKLRSAREKTAIDCAKRPGDKLPAGRLADSRSHRDCDPSGCEWPPNSINQAAGWRLQHGEISSHRRVRRQACATRRDLLTRLTELVSRFEFVQVGSSGVRFNQLEGTFQRASRRAASHSRKVRFTSGPRRAPGMLTHLRERASERARQLATSTIFIKIVVDGRRVSERYSTTDR